MRLLKTLSEWWNRNPYDEVVKKQQDLLDRNPRTPNLAKLAYYCGCEVEDIVKELKDVTACPEFSVTEADE